MSLSIQFDRQQAECGRKLQSRQPATKTVATGREDAPSFCYYDSGGHIGQAEGAISPPFLPLQTYNWMRLGCESLLDTQGVLLLRRAYQSNRMVHLLFATSRKVLSP